MKCFTKISLGVILSSILLTACSNSSPTSLQDNALLTGTITPTIEQKIEVTLNPTIPPFSQDLSQEKVNPALNPSITPEEKPIDQGLVKPTAKPTVIPTTPTTPATTPTTPTTPATKPTNKPAVKPTAKPSIKPTIQPSQDTVTSPSTYQYGNSSGNNMNFAIAVQSNGVIYYMNQGLYRSKVDGTGKKLLSSNNGNRLQIIGDWLYYSTDKSIWKIKTDGSSEQKLSNTSITHMLVVNNWIYYTKYNEVMDYDLWKMTTDGKVNERITLLSNKDIVIQDIFDVSGDWIYLPAYVNENSVMVQKFYKIKTDGSEVSQILDFAPDRYEVYNDQLYYFTRIDNSFYKINTDGSKNTRIYKTDFLIYSLNIYKDVIYFSIDSETGNEDTFGIYKVKTDGTGYKKLIDEQVKYFSIVSDWIYFTSSKIIWETTYDSNTNQYISTMSYANPEKMKIDGTQRQTY